MARQKTKGKRQMAKVASILRALLPFVFCPLPFAFFSFAL
jgi:hypothetical protein